MYRAFHDPLTELPNRAMFLAACSRALAGERRPDRVAVLFMDVVPVQVPERHAGPRGGRPAALGVLRSGWSGRQRVQMVARLGGDGVHGAHLRAERAGSLAVRTAQRVLRGATCGGRFRLRGGRCS
ncbi:diguanylate cyclase domain-containing protein [Tepidiforma flava]|uniref:diguanylate cyclase domain-containing protein n=1 Tax=Tepidiforma flava TaxID=3004094 RepID=UPI0035709871